MAGPIELSRNATDISPEQWAASGQEMFTKMSDPDSLLKQPRHYIPVFVLHKFCKSEKARPFILQDADRKALIKKMMLSQKKLTAGCPSWKTIGKGDEIWDDETFIVFNTRTKKFDKLHWTECFKFHEPYQKFFENFTVREFARDGFKFKKFEGLQNVDQEILRGLWTYTWKVYQAMDVRRRESADCIILKRSDTWELRKYFFLMTFLRNRDRNTHLLGTSEAMAEAKEKRNKFMGVHNLNHPRDLWLHNASVIVNTPHYEVSHQKMIFDFDQEDYRTNARERFMVFWEAGPNDEFLLTNNSFGGMEGCGLGAKHSLAKNMKPADFQKRLYSRDFMWHQIFVLSPKLAVALCHGTMINQSLLREQRGRYGLRPSLLDKLPHPVPPNYYKDLHIKETRFIKPDWTIPGEVEDMFSKAGDKSKFAANLEAKADSNMEFMVSTLSSAQVGLVNMILLQNQSSQTAVETIVYRNPAAIFRAIEEYEKMEWKMYTDEPQHSYKTFKRKIFNQFNKPAEHSGKSSSGSSNPDTKLSESSRKSEKKKADDKKKVPAPVKPVKKVVIESSNPFLPDSDEDDEPVISSKSKVPERVPSPVKVKIEEPPKKKDVSPEVSKSSTVSSSSEKTSSRSQLESTPLISKVAPEDNKEKAAATVETATKKESQSSVSAEAEKAKADKERAEKEKLAKEKLENEKAEKEKLEKEKAEREKIEKEKVEKQKLEKERLDKEKADREKVEKEKAEKERVDRERRLKLEEAEKEEAERLQWERAEAERTLLENSDESSSEEDEEDEYDRKTPERTSRSETRDKERRDRAKSEYRDPDDRPRAASSAKSEDRPQRAKSKVAVDRANRSEADKAAEASQLTLLQIERERLQQERAKLEALERRAREKERLERKKLEKDNLRLQNQLEQERQEKEAIRRAAAKEKEAHKNRLDEAARKNRELEEHRERLEAERLQRLAKERIEKERLEIDRLAREKEREKERELVKAKDRELKKQREREKLLNEKAEQERLQREREHKFEMEREADRLRRQREKDEKVRSKRQSQYVMNDRSSDVSDEYDPQALFRKNRQMLGALSPTSDPGQLRYDEMTPPSSSHSHPDNLDDRRFGETHRSQSPPSPRLQYHYPPSPRRADTSPLPLAQTGHRRQAPPARLALPYESPPSSGFQTSPESPNPPMLDLSLYAPPKEKAPKKKPEANTRSQQQHVQRFKTPAPLPSFNELDNRLSLYQSHHLSSPSEDGAGYSTLVQDGEREREEWDNDDYHRNGYSRQPQENAALARLQQRANKKRLQIEAPPAAKASHPGPTARRALPPPNDYRKGVR